MKGGKGTISEESLLTETNPSLVSWTYKEKQL